MKKVIVSVSFVLAAMAANAQFLPTSGNTSYYTYKKIGIGTKNPLTALHVRSNPNMAALFVSDSLAWGDISLGIASNNGSYSTLAVKGDAVVRAQAEGKFIFASSAGDFSNTPAGVNTEKFVFVTHVKEVDGERKALSIYRNGHVSIGSTSQAPQARLHVFDNAIIGPGLSTSELTGFNNGVASGKLKLLVNGTVGAKEFRCSLTQWSDFVFDSDYKLKPLSEVESFIQANKHLPEVPSEKEVVENGVAMGEMLKIHMQKIEELTLYMIELKKENQVLANRIHQLEGDK